MQRDYEAFDLLSSMFPKEFDREIANGARDAGEPESGVTSLLDFAYVDGFLTVEILDEADRLYPDGIVHEYSRMLRQKLEN